MRLLVLLAATLAVTVSTGAAFAGSELSDTIAARANARAGGPVSERQIELLERYGCESGTDNPVCYRDRRHLFRSDEDQARRRPRRKY